MSSREGGKGKIKFHAWTADVNALPKPHKNAAEILNVYEHYVKMHNVCNVHIRVQVHLKALLTDFVQGPLPCLYL